MSPARHALGLVVGKFAPLHLGHEWLIGQAARQCERLLVLSWSKPEFEGCGAAQRRQWLALRLPGHECHVIDDLGLAQACRDRGVALQPMPANDAADPVHQQWLAWLLAEVLRRQPDAMFCSEAYGPSCARTLARTFGKAVEAVLVDCERARFPISASAIRDSPALARRWTAPEVAATFIAHR